MTRTTEALCAFAALLLGVVTAALTAQTPAAPTPPGAADVADAPARSDAPPPIQGLAPTLAEEEQRRPAAVKLAALHASAREAMLPTARLMALLDVRPGMKVLDLGAGGGRMSAPMAARVGAEGVVYATDVDPAMIEVLLRRAQDEALPALRPRLVAPGVDPWYAGLRVDRVLLCSVYEYLEAPLPFLRALSAALRPDGRLLLLQGRSDAHYLASDFDIGFRLASLRSEPGWAPVWRRLPEPIRAGLATMDGRALSAPAAAPLRQALAARLALVLDAAPLPGELVAARRLPLSAAGLGAVAGADEAMVVRWIVEHHDLARPENWPRQVRADLNFRLLLGLFGDTFARELYPRGVYLQPEGIARRAEAAGLRRLPLDHGLAGHDALLFARDAAATAAPEDR